MVNKGKNEKENLFLQKQVDTYSYMMGIMMDICEDKDFLNKEKLQEMIIKCSI